MTEMREIATALKERLSGIVLYDEPIVSPPVGVPPVSPPPVIRSHAVPVFFGNPNPQRFKSRPVPCIIIEMDDEEADIAQYEGGRDYEEVDPLDGGERTVLTEDAAPTIITYMIRGYAHDTHTWDQLFTAIKRTMKDRSALDTAEKCWLFRRNFRIARVGDDETEYCGIWRYDVHAFITYPESEETRFATKIIEIAVGDLENEDTTTIVVEFE
jgi:hypothetical protein